MIVAGDGIAVDGAGSPSNPLVITAKPAPLVVADSSCITLSGGGTTTAPLTALPRLDSNPGNLLKCGPNGLIVSGGTGGTVATACGLTGDGSTGSPVSAAVSPWPFACSLDSAGGLVYCDSTGKLRSEPRGRVQYVAAFDLVTTPATVVPAGTTAIVNRSLAITNPDTCRSGLAIVNADVDIDLQLPANSGAGYGFNGDAMLYLGNGGSSTVTSAHVQVSKTWRVAVGAGATVSQPMTVEVGRGFGNARYTRIQWSIRSFLFVL
ncbi:hypothetical protein ACFRQM_43995 [Streptomyces sp. NPDC056831]|uniref:hypothetical protein n=1 Tax=Streptomyces sp. NPDC056831 TaxID=3345954 RepID=UPI0036B1D25F